MKRPGALLDRDLRLPGESQLGLVWRFHAPDNVTIIGPTARVLAAVVDERHQRICWPNLGPLKKGREDFTLVYARSEDGHLQMQAKMRRVQRGRKSRFARQRSELWR